MADSSLTRRGFVDLIAGHVRTRPDAVALQRGGTRVTYRQLVVQAEALAAEIRAAVAADENRAVAIALDPVEDFVVAVLAVLAAGHAYIALDPRQPAALLDRMLDTARPALLIASRGRSADGCGRGFDAAVGSRVRAGLVLRRRATLREARVFAPGILYIAVTSGTTGPQKAMPIPVAGVPRLFEQPGYARFGPDRRLLLLAPVNFDASNLELWGALLPGARLSLPDRPGPGIDTLCAQIRRDGIDTLWLTSGLFDLIVEQGAEALAGVTQIMVGGDVVSPAHLRRAMAALPGCRFVNGYGPTECTTFALCCPITPELAGGDAIPIGRPIARTEARIVGEDGRLVVPGQRGELWLAGAGLTPGYLDRPDLNAERFVLADFGAGVPRRFFRTGDICAERPDGLFEIHGRLDDEVKILGQRVQVSEVARLLGSHHDVAQAAVVAVAGADGRRRLAAAVVWKRPGADARALRRHITRRASRAHAPERIETVAALPLTPNGKIDRVAVAALFGPDGRGTGRRPATPDTLARIWQDCLGVAAVADGHFFDDGGTSLTAMRFLLDVEAQTGQRATLEDLFAAPRYDAFCARLGALPERAGRGHLVALRRDGGATPVIVVHGGGGGVVRFRSLPTHLRPDRPVYALEGDWAAPVGAPLTIKGQVAAYLAEIDRRLPDRPVHLAGLCFGGYLALDLAHAMRDAGRTVLSLTLADTACIAGAEWRMALYLAGYRAGRMLRHLTRGRPSLAALTPFERRMARALAGHRAADWPDDLHFLTGVRPWETAIWSQPARWRRYCSGRVRVHRVGGRRSAMLDETALPRTGAALEAIFAGAERRDSGAGPHTR